MKFLVNRESQGPVSKHAPCVEAIRGPESKAWPGDYLWFVELNTLEELMQFLNTHGGLGLWSAEEGEEYPQIEIFDEDEDEEDE